MDVKMDVNGCKTYISSPMLLDIQYCIKVIERLMKQK